MPAVNQNPQPKDVAALRVTISSKLPSDFQEYMALYKQNLSFLKERVKLPPDYNLQHWLRSHTIDFFQQASSFHAWLVEANVCTDKSCELMNFGSKVQFLWRFEPGQPGQQLPAPDYMECAFEWIAFFLENEGAFCAVNAEQSETGASVEKNIYQHLFRFFAHTYSAHYDELERLGLNRNFDQIFLHFMSFAVEFHLIPLRELKPAMDMLKKLCPELVDAIEDEKKTIGLSAEITNPCPTWPVQAPKILAGHGYHEPSDCDRRYRMRIRFCQNFVSSYYHRLYVETERFNREHGRPCPPKMSLEDFKLIRPLGHGGYGEVHLCQQISGGKVFALKKIQKKFIINGKAAHYARSERDFMVNTDKKNPWLVQLQYAFQDQDFLYYVMDFCQGGDLFFWLNCYVRFNNELAQFYIAELILAVQSVHERGYAHRDLKPENILVGKDGHLRLGDFGFVKQDALYAHEPSPRTLSPSIALSEEGGLQSKALPAPPAKHRRFFSKVGSKYHVAPEVLSGIGHDLSADWWSVGVILFQMLFGFYPFDERPTHKGLYVCTLCKIMKWNEFLFFPSEISEITDDAIDLLTHLLCDAETRFSFEEIKQHSFFKDLDWGQLRSRRAPFIVNVSSETDTKYFGEVVRFELTQQKENQAVAQVTEPTPPSRLNLSSLNQSEQTFFYQFAFRRAENESSYSMSSEARSAP